MVHERNPGMPLDMGWVNSVKVNKSAVTRRAATFGTRRTVKKEWQAAWLYRVISCIDLTALAGDDTAGSVTRLACKGKHPVRSDILAAHGMSGVTVGAICVYPSRVKDVVAALKGTNIGIASVATGFPSGQIPTSQKLEEIRSAVADGATEIDIVISRFDALCGDWQAVYDEVVLMREACGEAHMKTILATGELATLRNVYQASLVCMMAGADFIKTSTGKEKTNATLPVGLVMCRAIRDYYERTGYKVGFKPAGGIRAAKDACTWMSMMKEELGDEWVKNDLFRIGASALLNDVERQLSHGATNCYAADYYMPMA